ncbi:nuclear protein Qri2/Nse4 [Xylona heveae TC161]|uniref:Non-structural maintenance of chromosomes element 4 n=1 Tax=Xylona heveae (strain CBS 132557 / TC161) TaxID=1328760 RepID=A0A165H531_XYLHT|nr:nuclear protein Qri2/Nse4 [Xylona heveae TC161]KZF22994.1 nuclear protein Qri2/Nse4 [Xylona heveae TC161]
MARLARVSSSPEPNSNNTLSQTGREYSAADSPTPTASFSSDKENQTSIARGRQHKGKAIARPDMESSLPTPDSNAENSERGAKRRKVEALRQRENATQRAISDLEDIIDTKYYDPDQDPEERRRVRKQLRDLSRTLNESRQEFLNPDSKGLQETVKKANDLMLNVRNTSDATIDSRLLVTAADLGRKKISHLALGSGGQGIEIDEFVSKCINFMRHGTQEEEEGQASTQNHRHARQRDARVEDDQGESDEEDENDGDALNWAWLGRRACFPHNARPAVSGFLLGPLSVQKRSRVQRRQVRLQRRNPLDVVRPQELEATDLQKTENSNLTTLCKNIREQLQRTQNEGEARVNDEATEDMSQEEVDALMAKYAICDDGGVSFFKFVINPLSFGQTVENMFYVSFLIRDGSAGIGRDKHGMPTLHASIPMNKQTIREQNVHKHQAVFSLDWETWQGLIEAFDITDCCIPNRAADAGALKQGAGGWYG